MTTTFTANPSSTNSSSSNFQKWSLLLLLIAIWWGTSAWNSVAAKQAAKANPNCISIMAAASNWLGLVFFVIIKRWQHWQNPKSGQIDSLQFFKNSCQELWDIRYLSAAHAVGLYASYRGLVQGRVSLVQAVKAVEPLIAMAMSAVLYQQYPGDSRIILSALTVVAGTICVLVEDTSFAAPALLWTLTSSLATQGRNQIMKQRQKEKAAKTAAATTPSKQYDTTSQQEIGTVSDFQNDTSVTSASAPSVSSSTPPTSPAMIGLLMFINASAAAFVMNLIMLAIQIGLPTKDPLLRGVPLPTYEVLSAGANHFAYNLASFAVLSLVEMPATHSLANTAKRAVIIGVAAWKLQEPVTSKAGYGLVLVLGGSGCYGYFSKMVQSKSGNSATKIISSAAKSTSSDPLQHFMGRYVKHGILVFLALVMIFQTKYMSNTMGNFTVQSFAFPLLELSPFSTDEITDESLALEVTSMLATSVQRPCLYDTIHDCLKRNNSLSDNKDMTFLEQHAGIDNCVMEWLSSTTRSLDAHALTSQSTAGPSTKFALFTTGRGKLKDRLDWSLFRLNATAAARLNVHEKACGDIAFEEMPATSWRSNLPSVSQLYFNGGVFLPPWYGMEDTEERMEGGFVLPRGPIRRATSKINLKDGIDTNIFYSMSNLGDCYNNYLVAMLSGTNVTMRDRNAPSRTGNPYVCVVGSVLHPKCDIVWGTGIITSQKTAFQNPNAEVFATRGPDTLSLTPNGHKGRRVAFGDPGLLLSLLLPMPKPRSEVDFCVIPHYIDHDVPAFMELQKQLSKNNTAFINNFSVRILNIETCSLAGYVQQLSGCKKVLSSSLHGLVFAISYGIPGARLLFSDLVFGGHFKFNDFYKGIGHPGLYVHERVQTGGQIPFLKMFDILDKIVVPALNVEDLWNSNPFHAENIGIERADHLAYVRSYFENHQEFYPHKAYYEVPVHTKVVPAQKAVPVRKATRPVRRVKLP